MTNNYTSARLSFRPVAENRDVLADVILGHITRVGQGPFQVTTLGEAAVKALGGGHQGVNQSHSAVKDLPYLIVDIPIE